jgi:hypothetical protein
VSGKLVATAAALAAKHLAAATAQPGHAQAFVEMVADRGLLQPQQLQRAVHAVLQAYANQGDHERVSPRGILACQVTLSSKFEIINHQGSKSSKTCTASCSGPVLLSAFSLQFLATFYNSCSVCALPASLLSVEVDLAVAGVPSG